MVHRDRGSNRNPLIHFERHYQTRRSGISMAPHGTIGQFECHATWGPEDDRAVKLRICFCGESENEVGSRRAPASSASSGLLHSANARTHRHGTPLECVWQTLLGNRGHAERSSKPAGLRFSSGMTVPRAAKACQIRATGRPFRYRNGRYERVIDLNGKQGYIR
jgi:hypothetical protein